jgi:type IV pilus assembly protein PilO
MSVMDDLKSLDPSDPGRWPLPIRLGAIALAFVVLLGVLFYMLVWQKQNPILTKVQGEERTLRQEFVDKHKKAVNLAIYEQQLIDIEKSFGALLRQLPGKTEVPNLLVDISQVGVAAGLQEKLFQPAAESKKDFYAELPIKIRLTGNYHQFGEFVSGIAALPRIVTLHDIQVKPESKEAGFDQLSMDLTGKTYRYLDEDELAALEAERAKAEEGSKRRRGGKDKAKEKA